MDIKDAKAAVGSRCRVLNPDRVCYTLSFAGEYILTGYGADVEFYNGKPRRTDRIQLESVELRPVRVWVPAECVELRDIT